MFDIHRVELDWGGRKLVLESGRIARQADGAVLATYGETTVLATVVSDKEPREGIDFLPLTCNYQEKFYAAGRIPGAVMFGHKHFQPVIDAIISLAENAAKEPRDFALPESEAVEKEMLGLVEADLRAAYGIPGKQERHAAIEAAKAKAMAHFLPD